MFVVVYMELGKVYSKSRPYETETEARKEAYSFNTMNGELLKNKPKGLSCERSDYCYAKVVEE